MNFWSVKMCLLWCVTRVIVNIIFDKWHSVPLYLFLLEGVSWYGCHPFNYKSNLSLRQNASDWNLTLFVWRNTKRQRMIFILHCPHKALKEHLQADCHCIKLAGWVSLGVSSALFVKWSHYIVSVEQLITVFLSVITTQYEQIAVIENEAQCVY